jgi:hypothetical protein
MEWRHVTLLRGSKERCWSTFCVSWMSHDSSMKHTSTWMVTLTWKISDIGPQTIQGLPLPPERLTAWWVLSIVRVLGPGFIDGEVISDVYLSLLSDELGPLLMGYGIPTNSAWLQQDGVRPHTDNVVFRSLHDVCKDSIQSNRYPAIFEKGLSWPLTSAELNSCHYFFGGGTYGEGVSEKSAHNSGTESEVETVFTDTITSVPNSFVLQLDVRDLWGHHMKLLRL